MLISLSGICVILNNLRDNIIYFHPPSEIHKVKNKNSKIRLGGIVKMGSIIELSKGKIEFIITDHKAEIKVIFRGILPALFRENQGIVAEGRLSTENQFIASKLLTKHDENYKPPKDY